MEIDPLALLSLVKMLQQQVEEKTAALERSQQQLQQAEAEARRLQQKESELVRSQQELTDFIENAVYPMHWVASDGTIVWANQAELDLLGYDRQEYIGHSIIEFHVDRSNIDELLKRLSNNETVRNYQAQLRCKDGSIRDVKIDSNVSWQNDEFIHTRCFTRDVTQSLQLQEVRRQSEARLQAILDNTQAVIYLKDIQGRYLLVNRRYERVFRVDREEIKGKSDFDLFPQEIAEIFQANDRQVFENQKPIEREEIIPQANNLHAYFSLKFPLFDPSGLVYGMCGISTDITERKVSEQKLQETLRSLEFHKYALDKAAIVAITDFQGVITYANDRFCQIAKYNREELIGQTHRIINSDYHSPEFFQELWRTISKGQVWKGEIKNKAKDGSFYWVDTTIVPFLDERGKPFQYLAIRFDISDRKQAEQKIREQAALLDVATDAILVRDLNQRILFWNQGAARIYGWQTSEALDRDVRSLLYGETSLEAETTYATLLAKGEWQGELHKVTKQGKAITVESRWTLVRDEAGNPKFILSVDTDITEKKLLEAQFLRAQRLESLGTLASGIAHDMNNILTPILAAAQLLPLKLNNQDPQIQRLLQIAQENAKRGAELVKQILAFASGTEGERTQIQIADIVNEAIAVARQTFPKSIEIDLNLSDKLWLVAGDGTQLHQVLMNLLINARDAMPEGGILTAKAENLTVDGNYPQIDIAARMGNYVVVTITDTGIGISPETKERIFEPFFTTKEPGKGTGLGLSTVIGIIKSHQGFINVDSEVGRGTSFKLYLPADEQTETTQSIEDLELLKGNGELILIVDDEASVREVTKATLENYNYRVITACDGIEAISLYTSNKDEIEVVLLDLIIPSLDTSTIVRTLKRLNSKIKIIAMSGLAANGELIRVDYSCVRGFLAKPFTSQTILRILHDTVFKPTAT
jgi:two-component system, cell cycle sensor histidine kinase and response regulator CckA